MQRVCELNLIIAKFRAGLLPPDHLLALSISKTGGVVKCRKRRKWWKTQLCFCTGHSVLPTAWHDSSFLRKTCTPEGGMPSLKGARSPEMCCRWGSSAFSKQISSGFAGACCTTQLLEQCSPWCQVPRGAAGCEEPPEHQPSPQHNGSRAACLVPSSNAACRGGSVWAVPSDKTIAWL